MADLGVRGNDGHGKHHVFKTDLGQINAENDKMRAGLERAAEAFEAAAAALRDALPDKLVDEFARDFAGHINLMGAMGDPDYMRGKLSCRHIDTRQQTRKEKK